MTVERNSSIALVSSGGPANLVEGNKNYGVRCDESSSLVVDVAPNFGLSGNTPANEDFDPNCHTP